jgi:hypothetical protein
MLLSYKTCTIFPVNRSLMWINYANYKEFLITVYEMLLNATVIIWSTGHRLMNIHVFSFSVHLKLQHTLKEIKSLVMSALEIALWRVQMLCSCCRAVVGTLLNVIYLASVFIQWHRASWTHMQLPLSSSDVWQQRLKFVAGDAAS